MTESYRPHYFPDEIQMKKDRLRYLAYLPPGGRILDIGCGRGEFLELIKDSGRLGLGVESDPALVELCQKKGLNVLENDARSFFNHANKQSLDGIFMGHIVEHLTIDATHEILLNATSMLNPGGRLIILTPNPNYLPGVGSFWSDMTHQRPYSLEGLRNLFCTLGLREVSSGVSPESMLKVDWTHIWGALINVARLFLLKLIMLETYDGGEIYIVGEKK